MNIFTLDEDLTKCAQYHCDKHVVKMITEYNQLMSTTCHVLGIKVEGIYKKTHVNHPCAVWVRESRSNFEYLLQLNKELLKEYTYRYGKIHAGSRLIPIFESIVDEIPEGKSSNPPICMPEDSKVGRSVVLSYRKYYLLHKRPISKWKLRGCPGWFR